MNGYQRGWTTGLCVWCDKRKGWTMSGVRWPSPGSRQFSNNNERGGPHSTTIIRKRRLFHNDGDVLPGQGRRQRPRYDEAPAATGRTGVVWGYDGPCGSDSETFVAPSDAQPSPLTRRLSSPPLAVLPCPQGDNVNMPPRPLQVASMGGGTGAAKAKQLANFSSDAVLQRHVRRAAGDRSSRWRCLYENIDPGLMSMDEDTTACDESPWC